MLTAADYVGGPPRPMRVRRALCFDASGVGCTSALEVTFLPEMACTVFEVEVDDMLDGRAIRSSHCIQITRADAGRLGLELLAFARADVDGPGDPIVANDPTTAVPVSNG